MLMANKIRFVMIYPKSIGLINTMRLWDLNKCVAKENAWFLLKGKFDDEIIVKAPGPAWSQDHH